MLIPNEKAFELLKEYRGEIIFEIESNKAASYKLSNNTFLILPQEGDSSLFFQSKQELDEFLKKPIYPEPTFDPFYEYQNELTNISRGLAVFREKISSYIKEVNLNLKTEDDVRKFFGSLNDLFNNTKSVKSSLLIPIGVVLGEYLKEKYSLRWEKQMVYYFQPVFLVNIIDAKNLTYPLWKLLDDFYEDSFFDYDLFIEQMELYHKLSKRNL